jgi:hypothetical protein
MNNRADTLRTGRASLEFLIGAIVLFVPVLSLSVVLWSVTNAQLATEAAARHAARSFVQHTTLTQASVSAQSAAEHVLRQHDMDADSDIEIRCEPTCLRPNSWVEIRLTSHVPMAQLPLGTFQATLPVTATAYAQVSHYRGQP